MNITPWLDVAILNVYPAGVSQGNIPTGYQINRHLMLMPVTFSTASHYHMSYNCIGRNRIFGKLLTTESDMNFVCVVKVFHATSGWLYVIAFLIVSGGF